MAPRKNRRSTRRREQDAQDDEASFAVREDWEKEAESLLDESELRRKPDWLEAIGDEDEDTERIETNLRDDWALRGEDDYVSDPTAESDMPDWEDDDYDDEYDDREI